MKHLFPGAALIAALAFTAPLGAQPANPSGGNSMGMPGPSPGGPGLTPYSASPSAGPSPGDSALSGPRTPPPAGRAYSAPPPSSMSDTSSAMPPKHRASRHASHKASHHPSRFPNLQGNTVANQLNQAELARLQSGNFTPPPAPPGPDMSSPTPQSAVTPPRRMPAGGRATSTGSTRSQ